MPRIIKKMEIKNGEIIISKIEKIKICASCARRPNEKTRMRKLIMEFIENGGIISQQHLCQLMAMTI